jgi:chaperone BCS1
MDVWVNFTNATKWQAEGVFKYFFSSPSSPSPSLSNGASSVDASQKNTSRFMPKALMHTMPMLEETEITRLAKCFANAIPEGELTV